MYWDHSIVNKIVENFSLSHMTMFFSWIVLKKYIISHDFHQETVSTLMAFVRWVSWMLPVLGGSMKEIGISS